MLRLFAAIAPPIALLLVGVLLLEPPALAPRERIPTLRLLTTPAQPTTPSPEPPTDLVQDELVPMLEFSRPEAATAQEEAEEPDQLEPGDEENTDPEEREVSRPDVC